MKKKNILQLLETHVDKMVLALIILISLVILWMYVIGSPYGQVVDGRKRGPGEIDVRVKAKAEELRNKLDQGSDPIVYDKTYLAEYDHLMQCSISEIASAAIPYPGTGETIVEEDRIYVLPEIAPLTDIAVLNLRGAAQKPNEGAFDEMGYTAAADLELEDIDLVTVSAKFNVQSLYNGFQQSFTGPRLKTTWKDAKLAVPVFAKLDLQRRQLQDDGSWSSWDSVPRTRIDAYKKLLEELPLTTEQLQLGVDVWMNQYTDKMVQRDILQPEAYAFMISRSEWLPPAFLQEAFDLIQKQEDLQQKQLREERAKRLESPMNELTGRRPESTRPAPTRPEPRRQTENRRGRDPMMDMGYETPVTPQRQTRRERTLEDIKGDAKKVMLDDKTDIQSMRDSLLVWAHDDTVQPGSTYQYRLRIGIFNPIAGKNWFREDQSQYKNQVVLWSGYIETADQVYIPKRIHLFPTELLAAKDNPNGTEGAKIEVAKFSRGQWRTQTFDVFPGQVIGQKAEVKPEEIKPVGRGMEMGMMEMMPMETAAANTEPQIIDFTTPFAMVDINHLAAWGSNAQRRNSYDVVLYYDPQGQMKQAAIGKNNWDKDLRQEHQQVQDELERNKQMMFQEGMPIEGMPRSPMLEMQGYPPI